MPSLVDLRLVEHWVRDSDLLFCSLMEQHFFFFFFEEKKLLLKLDARMSILIFIYILNYVCLTG
jgi:hypothetical protein